jgi:hypothetical protein
MVLVTDCLVKMATRGQSISLHYGEDTGLWECSWVTSGKRYTGVSRDIPKAVIECMEKAGLRVP